MQQRIVIVRSDKCTNSSTNACNAQFVFPVPVVVPPNGDATVQLLKVSFAHSYYLINGHTDTLVISGVTYTLAHGNFNAATMLRYLTGALPLSVAYTPRTYKFTFSSATAFSIGATSTCLGILGITPAQCDLDVTSLEGAHVADLHGIHSIKVKTNFFVDSLDSSSSGGRDPHLLARIPVMEDTHTGASFRYENYTPATKYKARVFDRVISEFSATLADADNRPIEFNGVPFSVKVMIDTTTRPGEKFSPMIAELPSSRYQLGENASSRTSPPGAIEEVGDANAVNGSAENWGARGSRARRRERSRNARPKRKNQPTRKK
jgi:hypothetical protein